MGEDATNTCCGEDFGIKKLPKILLDKNGKLHPHACTRCGCMWWWFKLEVLKEPFICGPCRRGMELTGEM
jgi:hypothetical protein